jgi:hypothetical protein
MRTRSNPQRFASAAAVVATLGLSVALPARALAVADSGCLLNLGDRVLETPLGARPHDGPVASSCNHEGSGVRFETLPSSGGVKAGAEADHGVLEAAARYAASNAMGAGATAVASFTDVLTLDAAGRDGTRGRARVRWVLAQGLEADAAGGSVTPFDPTASARVSFAAQIPGGGGLLEAGAVASDGPDGPSFAQTALEPMDFGFVFGAPFAFTAQLRADAEGDESGAARADGTLYWAGFEFVRDAEGGAVDYTVASSSGTDYDRSFAPVASIPEPGTPVLFLGGVLLLAALRRGRGRERR